MNTATNVIQGLLYNAEGAGATEYAILISFIALAVFTGVTAFGGMVLSLFANAVAKFPF
jgi:Flp pilus assembly pilin Flp